MSDITQAIEALEAEAKKRDRTIDRVSILSNGNGYVLWHSNREGDYSLIDSFELVVGDDSWGYSLITIENKFRHASVDYIVEHFQRNYSA